MTSQSDADRTPAATEEEGGGLLPAIIVGAGILIVAALLIFDFGGTDDATGDKEAAGAASAQNDGDGKAGAPGSKGGVQARPYDAAQGSTASRINPAVRLQGGGMATQAAAPPPEEPPTFANPTEEIAWLEKKLVGAKKIRDDRQKFADRLPTVKERIEAGPNPQEGLKAFEGRKKIVQDNLDKAVQKVSEIEARLTELRGG